ncbi:hypothetical protein C8Q73DRAFT_787385 [Cubamyces lactineus]|nr:hypothetical protein C8Q73DRAFT_787385 [Cubamyces lactineus]
MPAASIHDLAVEVLEQIFAYACTDGGRTGYSLSLVSKHCYTVVRPLLLHNVALHSLKEIESFTTYLEREQRLSPHSRVYHLFVSTTKDGEQVARIRRAQRAQQQTRPSRPSQSWDDLDKRLSVALPHLLRAVAPSLLTLSLVHSWELTPVLLPRCLPCLGEFTACGPTPRLPGWNDGRSSLALPAPCLPVVRRLHIVSETVSLVPWAHHAPRVRQLSLSRLTEKSTTLPWELQAVLDRPAGSSICVGRAWSGVEHVRIQLRASHVDRGAISVPSRETYLKWLKKTQTRCDGKLEVMPSCLGDDDTFWEGRLKKDWLDSLGGKPGCWARKEQEDSGAEAKDGSGSQVLSQMNLRGLVSRQVH